MLPVSSCALGTAADAAMVMVKASGWVKSIALDGPVFESRYVFVTGAAAVPMLAVTFPCALIVPDVPVVAVVKMKSNVNGRFEDAAVLVAPVVIVARVTAPSLIAMVMVATLVDVVL